MNEDTFTFEEAQAVEDRDTFSYEEAQPSQHPLKSVAWGAAQGGFDVGSILAAVGDWAKGPDWSPANVERGLRGEPNPTDLLPKMSGVRERGMAAVTDPTNQYPIRAPETTSERAWAGGGRGLPYLPATVAGLGPLAGVAELGMSFATPFVSENVTDWMTDKGEEPSLGAVLTGGAAEIGTAAVATPLMLPRVMKRQAGRTVQAMNRIRAKSFVDNAPAEAHKLLELLNERAGRMWNGMFPGTENVATPPKFTMEDLFDVSSQLKGKLPVDADGALDYPELVAKMMDNSLEQWPGPGGPRPSQVGEADGVMRDTWRRMEEGLQRIPESGDRWGNVVAGQQDKLGRDLRQKFHEGLRDGSARQYADMANANIEAVARSARDDWDAIPFDDMPEIELARIEAAAKEVMDSSRFQEDLVPAVVRRLTKRLPNQAAHLNMQEVQNLRSRLLAIERDGEIGGEAAISATKAREVRNSLDELIDNMGPTDAQLAQWNRASDGLIDDLSPDGQNLDQWNKARASWRAYKELTDTDKTSGGDIIRTLSSKNPETNIGRMAVSSLPDAKRAVALAGDDPKALASLQRSVQDYVLGTPKPNSITGGSATLGPIENRLAKSRDGISEVVGEEWLNDLDMLLEVLSQEKRGRLGKVAMETTTGSNVTVQNRAATLLRALKTPLKSAKGGAGSVLERIAGQLSSEADRVFLLQVIGPDRELLRDLMRLPTNTEIPSYLIRLEQAIRKASTRRVPGAVARAATGNDVRSGKAPQEAGQ